MKLIWSDFAVHSLRRSFEYYRKHVSEQMARNIKQGIFKSTNALINNPKIGIVEPSLAHLNLEYRFIISGNYKIIYRPIKEGLLITDIFDSRQSPRKIVYSQ